MTVEEDEAMAKALQEKYERQAAKRRSNRMSSRSSGANNNNNSINRAQSVRSNKSGEGSDEEGPARSLRASSHKPSAQPARSSRNLDKERSSHRISVPTAAEDPPDTSNDAEMARRLAERSAHRRERSSHRRSDPPEVSPATAEARATPDTTSNDADRRERSSHRRTGMEKSMSVRRGTSVERSVRQTTEPKEEEAAPDTSNDAELARRLAERSSHRRTTRSTSVERTSVRRITTTTAQPEEQKDEVAPPDTSNDEALARRLAERSAPRRSNKSSRRLADPPEESAAAVPDTANDEEIARRLAASLQTKSKRRIVQPVAVVGEQAPTPELDDEALARKLEQELKDEEMAQRISQQDAKRRRRTSYLARKKAAQRNRKSEDDPSGSAKAARSSLQGQDAPDLNSFDSGEEYGDAGDGGGLQRGRSRRSKSQKNVSRNRSRSRDSDDGVRTSSRHRSRSRDPDDFNGLSSRETRSSTKSKRDMRSKSPIRQEQALVLDLHEESDRDLAMKLDQEGRDEALARSLTMREANRIAVYQVDSPQTTRGRNRWTCRRLMSLAIPVVVILAAIVGLAFAFTGGEGINISGVPPFFEEGDPFQGKNPDEANRWRTNTNGNGLELELLNALNERWHVNFDVAVNDWDFGDPDALTLTVQTVAIDSACSDLTGYLKVCNGDYGETKWRGINQVILSNGFIISSVAKLNEFYLSGADEAQRQYTMCHEIGHGFGLPHTDENFYNADLGNCMDYTSNPEANKSPDETNYAFLEDLYGTVKNRRLRHRKSSNVPKFTENEPADLHLRVDEAVSELEEGVLFSNGRFKAKMLHSSPFSESVLIDVGDGFQVQVSKLLAEPEAA